METLDSNASYLPVKEASPRPVQAASAALEEVTSSPSVAEASPPVWEDCLAWPAEMKKASPEAAVMQDKAGCLQDPSSLPLFACRPMTRLKFLQAPEGEVPGMTHWGREYTTLQKTIWFF